MRRKNLEITDMTRIEKILRTNMVGRLGMCDDGAPYIVPMNYGCEINGDKITLYFHSAFEGKKVDIMRQNPRICFETDTSYNLTGEGDVACKYSYDYESFIGWGNIKILETVQERTYGLKVIMKHQTDRDFEIPENHLGKTLVIKLVLDEYTAKRSKGV